MEVYNMHPAQKRGCLWCRGLPWRCLLAFTIVFLLALIYFIQNQQIAEEADKETKFMGLPLLPDISISHRIVGDDDLLPPEFIRPEQNNDSVPSRHSESFGKMFYPYVHSKKENVEIENFDIEEDEEENGIRSAFADASDIPNIQVKGAECDKIIRGDPKAIQAASLYQKNNQIPFIPDMKYPHLTENCQTFKHDRRYILKAVSKEEAEFPIAFSIVMFKAVDQFERLLRAIYRPQNYYCIHVDKKANFDVIQAVTGIVKCFDNVFMSSRSVSVMWGTFSVLEPELICMGDLVKRKKWKYFINLTGQEFPLKTNLDLVQILKAFNGSNNMEGTVRRRNKERTHFIHKGFFKTNLIKDPPLVDVTLTKGAVHITATRGYVEFVLNDPRALTFRKWVKDTGVPDETFFSSLDHSPQLGVPGAYKGLPETNAKTYPFLTRFKNWGGDVFDYPCMGKRERLICIFALGDLRLLSSRRELFANKFHHDYHPLALGCMEQLHFNRTRDEILGKRVFDVAPYAEYEFVWNHV